MRAIRCLPCIGVFLLQYNSLIIPCLAQNDAAPNESKNDVAKAAAEAETLYQAAQRAYFSGDYAEGIKKYRKAWLANPNRPLSYYNSIAWAWATCPDKNLRNSRVAVDVAHFMCEKTKFDDPFYLDTYAAALADTGDFTNAVKWQQKAVELAPTAKTFPKRELASSQLRLELYKQRRPYYEVPENAILDQYKKIVGKRLSKASLRQITADQKAELKSYLLNVPECKYMQATNGLVIDRWDMVLLILTSESMDHEERQDWTQRLSDMTESEVQKLRNICLEEREKLDAADEQYEQQVASLRRAPPSSDTTKAEQHFASASQQEQTVFKPEIKIEPKITLSASPPKKAVDVLIHSVTVYSTNAAGKAWDRSGPPDLKVCIRNVDNGDSFTTPTKRDTESADFNCKAIRVSEGQKIRVTVLDDDVFFDDTIGSYEKEITADTMKQGKVEWSFDRVSSLVLEFQP
jgi:tetratricopeptide (TPR) repeat protein